MVATTKKRARERPFGTMTRPMRDGDVINRCFPHQRYKPKTPRPTLTKSPDTLTLSIKKARRFLTVQKVREMQNM